MAFTRKFLSALGIEDDKVDEIIQAHTEVTNGLKEERDKYRTEAEQYKDKAGKLQEVQKELDDLKSGNETNEYEVKYNQLQEEFEAYKSDVEKKETTAKKKEAYRNLLKEAGVNEKRIDTIIKASPSAIEEIEFDDQGNVKGAGELKTKISEEWADFIVKTETKGANTANPPTNTNGGGMSKDEIMAITDRSKRREAIAENPEAFGIAKE